MEREDLARVMFEVFSGRWKPDEDGVPTEWDQSDEYDAAEERWLDVADFVHHQMTGVAADAHREAEIGSRSDVLGECFRKADNMTRDLRRQNNPGAALGAEMVAQALRLIRL